MEKILVDKPNKMDKRKYKTNKKKTENKIMNRKEKENGDKNYKYLRNKTIVNDIYNVNYFNIEIILIKNKFINS